MLLFIYQYFLGYLRIEINGASPERFLNMCIHHHINIWNLVPNNKVYTCYIMRNDFKKLRPILQKTKCKVKIIDKYGFPFFLFHYRKRKIFAVGILVFIFTIFYMSQYLWHIELSGNHMYTTEDIIAFLNEQGIQKAAKINTINCDDVVSLLRKEYDDIIWASAHIDGSKIMIEVKENTTVASVMEKETLESGYDLIAECGGTITSIITSKGTPLVKIGDTVEMGDILVSGRIDVTNDYGEIISYNYVTAEANISLETTCEYRDTLNIEYLEKQYLSCNETSYFFDINQYRILIKNRISALLSDVNIENCLWDIQCQTFDIAPTQQSILLLNVGYIKANAYEFVKKKYTKDEAQIILSKHFDAYCTDLEEKKVEIIENNVKIHIGEDIAQAQGTLTVELSNTVLQKTEVLAMPIIMTEEGTTE